MSRYLPNYLFLKIKTMNTLATYCEFIFNYLGYIPLGKILRFMDYYAAQLTKKYGKIM